MKSEKNFKKQRKAFVKTVKNLIFIAMSNPFVGKEISLTLPRIPNISKENIQPILLEALGYIPKIILFQETEISGEDSQKIPVVLIIFELK